MVLEFITRHFNLSYSHTDSPWLPGYILVAICFQQETNLRSFCSIRSLSIGLLSYVMITEFLVHHYNSMVSLIKRDIDIIFSHFSQKYCRNMSPLESFLQVAQIFQIFWMNVQVFLVSTGFHFLIICFTTQKRGPLIHTWLGVCGDIGLFSNNLSSQQCCHLHHINCRRP